jgi:hypothetical protein
MRILPSILGFVVASFSSLTAQVTVEVLFDQEQFLRDESLPARVRITNRSGQTLRLGQQPDWLTFAMESREGSVVSKLGDAPVQEEFLLESSMVAVRRVDLMPYFDLSLPGRYRVTAMVKIREWNEEVSSKPKSFEIVRGTKIWEQEFGVPGTGAPPEVRKYALQQANYLKRLLLYVRLTDETENRVFKVFPVGPLVSFSRPEVQLDKQSHLHLLFQTGARAFLYAVINPNGQIVVRQTHDYARTRPVLKSQEDGQIFVSGGTRRVTSDDIPVSSAASSTNDVQAPKL